jgi:small multidrug resistance family-3 protein
MKHFVNKALDAAKKYTALDFGLFKLCLFSFGIIFGVYFHSFFSVSMPIAWGIFVATWAWLVYKTFFKYWK